MKISVSLSTNMGIGYGPVVALYTALSIGGIAWKLNSVLRSTYNEDQQALDPTEAANMLQSLLQSSVMVALLGNLMVNFFLLITLSMKVRDYNAPLKIKLELGNLLNL